MPTPVTSLILSKRSCEEIHRLWDELADFGASRTDDALVHLMEHFARHLDLQDVVWVGAGHIQKGRTASRDAQKGWRGLALRHLRQTAPIRQLSQQAAKEQDTDPGMTTRALTAGAGSFRVHRLHDRGFIDVKAFKQTAHYRTFYQQAGIVDRMFVGFPLNDDAESFFLLDRIGNTKLFSDADAEYVAYAMRGLKWFHRELMLSHGLLVASSPFSSVERKIVHLLLTEKSEAEIAEELGQSPKTTHKYITEILRRFGVKGRTGLMALWLGRQS